LHGGTGSIDGAMWIVVVDEQPKISADAEGCGLDASAAQRLERKG
jgi:hypothetical protein